VKEKQVKMYLQTRNTFCGTWYLPIASPQRPNCSYNIY